MSNPKDSSCPSFGGHWDEDYLDIIGEEYYLCSVDPHEFELWEGNTKEEIEYYSSLNIPDPPPIGGDGETVTDLPF